MILKFGKHKGKDMKQVPTEYLFWLTENTDVTDPKYAISNQALVNACHDVINSRADGPKAARQDIPTIQLQKPGKQSLFRSIQALIDSLYKHAAEMQKLLDEHNPDGTITTTQNEHLPF